MTTNVIKTIETLDEQQIESVKKFIENLTKTKDLLPVFAEKLKTIKNNPIEESKIAKKQKEIEKLSAKGKMNPSEVLLEIVEAVYTVEEIEALEEEYGLTLVDLVRFGGAISEKVFGLKEIVDGEEVFKEIESHNKLKPVPYSKKREIRDQQDKYIKAINASIEYSKTANPKKEKLDELQETIEKEEKLFNIKINNGHNLDTENMSDWEKELLKQKVLANAYGSYMPKMGKK